MIKRLTDLPEPLAQARPDIVFPPALQAAMDRALARAVSDRYSSAGEFGRDVVAAVGGAAVPETRMDIDRVHSAATQMLDTEAAIKLVKKKESAAAAPAPGKKFPLIPALGGVGGVGVLAVVAVLALGKGGGGGAGADSTQMAANPPAGGQQPVQTENQPSQSKQAIVAPPTGRPGTPTNRPDARPAGQPSTNPPTQPGAVTTATTEDSLNAAVRADQSGQTNVSRRLARWVFYQEAATPKQRADAAELVATSYDQPADSAQNMEWLQNALRHAVGSQRTRIQNAITALGGTP